MDYVLDSVDKKILAILKENARESFANIARQVGLSEGAIRKRIKSLVDSKVIGKFTIESVETQHPVKAMVMVRIEAKASSEKITNYIRTLHGIDTVHPITGGYDICVEVGVDSNKELQETITTIRAQKGVMSTLTMTILQ